MKCENCFCIYQAKGKCIIKNVSINSMGMCTECIYADIDEKILKQSKLKILNKHKNSDNDL